MIPEFDDEFEIGFASIYEDGTTKIKYKWHGKDHLVVIPVWLDITQVSNLLFSSSDEWHKKNEIV